jgi:hypothetical protein
VGGGSTSEIDEVTTGVEGGVPPAITVGQGTKTISSSKRKSREVGDGVSGVAVKGNVDSSKMT